MSVNIWNKTTHILKRAAGKPGLFTRLLPGLVPTAPSGSGTSKYLREDGSWTVPSTNAAQSGTAQSTVSSTIAAGTSMDDVAKTLLENDATLKDALNDVQKHNFGTEIEVGDGITTTSDGYFIFRNVGGTGVLTMSVNGTELASVYCTASTPYIKETLFVRKSSQLSQNPSSFNGNYQCRFIPLI